MFKYCNNIFAITITTILMYSFLVDRWGSTVRTWIVSTDRRSVLCYCDGTWKEVLADSTVDGPPTWTAVVEYDSVVCSMGSCKVIVFYFGCSGDIDCVEVAPASCLSIVYFSEKWMRAKRHLQGNIFMENTPFPGCVVAVFEKFWKVLFHIDPGKFHTFLIRTISFISLFDVIVEMLVGRIHAEIADIVMW